jgi:hypothetical protein
MPENKKVWVVPRTAQNLYTASIIPGIVMGYRFTIMMVERRARRSPLPTVPFFCMAIDLSLLIQSLELSPESEM